MLRFVVSRTDEPRDGSFCLRQSGTCLLLRCGAAAKPPHRTTLIGNATLPQALQR